MEAASETRALPGERVVNAVFINPGSGPVPNATAEHAAANMIAFVRDCAVPELVVLALPQHRYEGRWPFLLWRCDTTRAHRIDMPGLPLHQVRYLRLPEQNPWDFPRLYVDDSSWLWQFALLSAEDFSDAS